MLTSPTIYAKVPTATKSVGSLSAKSVGKTWGDPTTNSWDLTLAKQEKRSHKPSQEVDEMAGLPDATHKPPPDRIYRLSINALSSDPKALTKLQNAFYKANLEPLLSVDAHMSRDDVKITGA